MNTETITKYYIIFVQINKIAFSIDLLRYFPIR